MGKYVNEIFLYKVIITRLKRIIEVEDYYMDMKPLISYFFNGLKGL